MLQSSDGLTTQKRSRRKSFNSTAMASVPFFNPSNQVSFSTTGKIPGLSKAQMCLKKIIGIIVSRGISRGSSLNPQFDGFRPDEIASGEGTATLFPCHRGFGIDLNLRLGPLLETVGSDNPSENRDFSACSAVGVLESKVCGINIDCNSPPVSVDVSTVEKSSVGECDLKEVGNSSGDFPASELEGEVEAVEEETRQSSEITNLQIRSSGNDNMRVCEETEDVEQSETIASEDEQQGRDESEDEKGRLWNEENKNDGYLGLLVEAARLISGNFEDEELEPESGRLRHESSGASQRRAEAQTETKEPVGCRSKRNRCWMLDFYEGFEDISPVVRSKRGRNQVLPCRYRDSVLEPWKRLPRQRSTRVSTKGRPK